MELGQERNVGGRLATEQPNDRHRPHLRGCGEWPGGCRSNECRDKIPASHFPTLLEAPFSFLIRGRILQFYRVWQIPVEVRLRCQHWYIPRSGPERERD